MIICVILNPKILWQCDNAQNASYLIIGVRRGEESHHLNAQIPTRFFPDSSGQAPHLTRDLLEGMTALILFTKPSLLILTILFTSAAISTLFPQTSASKVCIPGYYAHCIFTPFSTIICILLAGIICSIRKRKFTTTIEK